MDDIIAAIGSWLTETHEAKRRMVSNLEMLFWTAAAIVSALAAKDYAAKRKAMMVRAEQALPEKDLVATSFSDEQVGRLNILPPCDGLKVGIPLA